MSFANNYNSKGNLFTISTEEFEYKKPSELLAEYGENKVYQLRAIYINTKSVYGDNPIFATNDCLVDIPGHMLETAKAIREDTEAINDINAGKVGFKIRSFVSKKFNKVGYSIDFVDVE